MKIQTTLAGLALAAGLATAQETRTTETTEVRQNPDGTTTETTTTTTATFNPDARQKVVTYFSAYKDSPHGLPPAWSGRVKVEKIPAEWRTARVAPGTVITETNRSYLVEASPDLVEILPKPAAEVRYYVAGSNLVAVDSSYRVVDSIHVPTITYQSTTVETAE